MARTLNPDTNLGAITPGLRVGFLTLIHAMGHPPARNILTVILQDKT
ncbi:MAG TPA: hypothetical protein VOA64_10150 [Candidatus Dormibacteraeota bacterium]|nr:hypothetical protein [Candidatus Dormibacteraeota bacterium]